MREVIVKTWCDACAASAENDRTEGDELVLTFGELGSTPLTLALCERHAKELYVPLRDLLVGFGQPPAGADKQPTRRKKPGIKPPPEVEALELADGTWPCPACSHVALNRKALQTHVRARHRTTLAELQGVALPFPCEECGRQFASAQGRGAHRRVNHGVAGNSHPNKAKAG